MEKFAALDLNGKDLAVGDWVRVVQAPVSIGSFPEETKTAFSNAIGRTFRIQSFNEIGWIELWFHDNPCLDSIWIEPFLVRRFRRYKLLKPTQNPEP